jgi:hypothetical protein
MVTKVAFGMSMDTRRDPWWLAAVPIPPQRFDKLIQFFISDLGCAEWIM